MFTLKLNVAQIELLSCDIYVFYKHSHCITIPLIQIFSIPLLLILYVNRTLFIYLFSPRFCCKQIGIVLLVIFNQKHIIFIYLLVILSPFAVNNKNIIN